MSKEKIFHHGGWQECGCPGSLSRASESQHLLPRQRRLICSVCKHPTGTSAELSKDNELFSDLLSALASSGGQQQALSGLDASLGQRDAMPCNGSRQKVPVTHQARSQLEGQRLSERPMAPGGMQAAHNTSASPSSCPRSQTFGDILHLPLVMFKRRGQHSPRVLL